MTAERDVLHEIGSPGSKRLAREKLATTADPLRVAIVTALARTPQSAAQLADALSKKPQRVRYHLRRMREVDLVDVVGTTVIAGVRENRYSVQPARFVLTDGEIAWLTPHELDRALAAMVRLMFREASAAVGIAPVEREAFMVRVPLPLDLRGWREAAALHRESLRQVVEASERSLERLRDSREKAIETLALILLVPLRTKPVEGSASLEVGDESATGRSSSSNPHRQRRSAAGGVRLAVMTQLALEPAGAGDLASELDLPLEQVRYQLRRLSEEGLIAVHAERPRRGTVERIFVADLRRAAEHDSRLATESPRTKRAMHASIVREIFTEILEAIRVNAVNDRPDHTAARVALTLDPVGLQKIEAILTATAERLFTIREESLQRLGKTGAEPQVALSAILHFG